MEWSKGGRQSIFPGKKGQFHRIPSGDPDSAFSPQRPQQSPLQAVVRNPEMTMTSAARIVFFAAVLLLATAWAGRLPGAAAQLDLGTSANAQTAAGSNLFVAAPYWLEKDAAPCALPDARSDCSARTTSIKGVDTGSCCCPPRWALPVRKTIFETRTVFRTRTASRGKQQNKRERSPEEPATEPEAALDSDQPQLYARHLCSMCPAGIKVLGQNSGSAGAVRCCAPRKTVTIRRTKKITRTKTFLHAGCINRRVMGMLRYSD